MSHSCLFCGAVADAEHPGAEEEIWLRSDWSWASTDDQRRHAENASDSASRQLGSFNAMIDGITPGSSCPDEWRHFLIRTCGRRKCWDKVWARIGVMSRKAGHVESSKGKSVGAALNRADRARRRRGIGETFKLRVIWRGNPYVVHIRVLNASPLTEQTYRGLCKRLRGATRKTWTGTFQEWLTTWNGQAARRLAGTAISLVYGYKGTDYSFFENDEFCDYWAEHGILYKARAVRG